MKIIKKYQNPASRLTVESDNTTVSKPIITNLPVGDDLYSMVKRAEAFNKAVTDAEKYALPYPMNLTPEEKFYMDLALIGADENERQEIFKRYYNTLTIGPENIAARTGHIQVNPKTGDVIQYTAPTIISAEPLSEGQRMWQSPAFQLALAPMLDIPMFYEGLNSKILANGITRSKGLKGELRLSLPSHTKTSPRQLVLEPAGDNKFRPHIRVWDGEHIPGVLSNQDKTALYEAMYDALPDGAELLFPQSGLDYQGTRGTVAGLLRLRRDPRFVPGSKGVLYYTDKDGTTKVFTGNSFIKSPKMVKKPYSTPEIDIASLNTSIGTSDPQFLGYMESILHPSSGHKSIESRFGESLFGKGLSLYTFQDAENPNLILKVTSGKYNTLEELQAAIDRELMAIKGLPLQEPFNVEGFIINKGKLTPVFSQTNLKSLNYLPVEEFNAKYGQLIADKLAPYGYKVVSDPGKPLIFSNGKSRLTSFIPQNAGLNANGELRFFDITRDNIVNPQDNIINWLMQLKSTDPQQYEIMSQTLGIEIPDIF